MNLILFVRIVLTFQDPYCLQTEKLTCPSTYFPHIPSKRTPFAVWLSTEMRELETRLPFQSFLQRAPAVALEWCNRPYSPPPLSPEQTTSVQTKLVSPMSLTRILVYRVNSLELVPINVLQKSRRALETHIVATSSLMIQAGGTSPLQVTLTKSDTLHSSRFGTS